MRPYTPQTNKGRTISRDDIHHKTADCPKSHRKASSKRAKHQARQEARKIKEYEL